MELLCMRTDLYWNSLGLRWRRCWPRTFAQCSFIRMTLRGFAAKDNWLFRGGYLLKTSSAREGKMESTVGSWFNTGRSRMKMVGYCAGTRLARISMIEGKRKNGCKVRIWHYAKKSITRQCSKKLSVRQSRYMPC